MILTITFRIFSSPTNRQSICSTYGNGLQTGKPIQELQIGKPGKELQIGPPNPRPLKIEFKNEPISNFYILKWVKK